ncbi:3448_t:CDS:1, partial [Acaulospora colombiana]
WIGDEVTKLETVLDVIGDHHSSCLPKTRINVLNAIREWADDPSSPQIWWLTDVAGAGKSTIAKHLSDEWRRERKLGACFFFDKNRRETSNTHRFCETIAYQFATNHLTLRPSVIHGIRELHSDPSFAPLVDKLREMVIGPVKGSGLILVIDALDECDKADRGKLLHNLLDLLPQARPTKLLVTSRAESDLAHHLERYRSKTDSLHDVDLQSNQNDISIFVENQLSSLVLSSILGQNDVKLLSQRVSCLFILASTACKAINDDLDPRAMLEILLSPKSNALLGINELYETILRKACINPQ